MQKLIKKIKRLSILILSIIFASSVASVFFVTSALSRASRYVSEKCKKSYFFVLSYFVKKKSKKEIKKDELKDIINDVKNLARDHYENEDSINEYISSLDAYLALSYVSDDDIYSYIEDLKSDAGDT